MTTVWVGSHVMAEPPLLTEYTWRGGAVAGLLFGVAGQASGRTFTTSKVEHTDTVDGVVHVTTAHGVYRLGDAITQRGARRPSATHSDLDSLDLSAVNETLAVAGMSLVMGAEAGGLLGAETSLSGAEKGVAVALLRAEFDENLVEKLIGLQGPFASARLVYLIKERLPYGYSLYCKGYSLCYIGSQPPPQRVTASIT